MRRVSGKFVRFVVIFFPLPSDPLPFLFFSQSGRNQAFEVYTPIARVPNPLNRVTVIPIINLFVEKGNSIRREMV
jgi:hypothetical protein